MLSDIQQKALAGWKRPEEALRVDSGGQNGAVVTPTMRASGKIDLVQDVTADCSVVASLCAGVARAEEGFGKVHQLAITECSNRRADTKSALLLHHISLLS